MTNIIVKTFDTIYNYARANALSPFVFTNSCCEQELTKIKSENSPKQADLLIIAGIINHKNAPVLLRIYEQMPEPKYVMAIGDCACNGGKFKTNNYTVIKGVEKIIPVDVSIEACPPSEEDIKNAFKILKEKIKSETITKRKEYIDTHKTELEYKSYLDILTKNK